MNKSLRDEVVALAMQWRETARQMEQSGINSSIHAATNLLASAHELESAISRHPPADGVDGYYIQDSRSYVGNCMSFWGPDRNGYTTNIDEAGVYSREDAESQHRSRETDIPWPVAYIRSKAAPRVDFQYVNKADAILAEGKV